MKTKRRNDTVYTRNEQKEAAVTPAMRALIRRALRAALQYEAFPYPAEISVTFVDGETIRRLNREWRGKDAVTDVLSFPEWESIAQINPEADCVAGGVALGDIVLCVSRAMQQAQQFGHSLDRELAFLSVHSLLHLLGYDHELGEEQDREMRRKQKEILHSIGLDRLTEEKEKQEQTKTV